MSLFADRSKTMLPLALRIRRINWRFRLWLDPDGMGVVEWTVFAVVIAAIAAAGFLIVGRG